MPLYEYRCKECGYQFEIRHGVNDPVPRCLACNGEVRKVFHPPPIIFKGSGWHITDYDRYGRRGADKPTETKSKEKSGTKTAAAED